MRPGGVQKKSNFHAPRDGTAARRHGGAAREHFIFSKKLYVGLLVGSTVRTTGRAPARVIIAAVGRAGARPSDNRRRRTGGRPPE